MKNLIICHNVRILITQFVLGLFLLGGTLFAGESALITPQTPWRVWLVHGANTILNKEGVPSVLMPQGQWKPWAPVPIGATNAALSECPSESWIQSTFDDSLWGRHTNDLFEYFGGYGAMWGTAGQGGGRCPTMLCLRTRFGVEDPSKVQDLSVTVEYLGGVAIYVNGQEIARKNLPAGTLSNFAPATVYPVEVYTTEDGRALPVKNPNAKEVSRYQPRIRTITTIIPSKVLQAGGNVLALRLHRAPVTGPFPQNVGWSHVALRAVTLKSPSGNGVIAYDQAVKGTRVWSAQTLDEVVDTPSTKTLIHGGGWGAVTNRGDALRGISIGNPFDPVVPVRIFLPRNGIGNGQAVLSDPAGLKGIKAQLADFKGASGAGLPSDAVRLRFSMQNKTHYCTDLSDKAPEGAKTVPVWIEVTSKADQKPGWYTSTLSLEANGKSFSIPVQVFVTSFVLPRSQDFCSLIIGNHSPEALAYQYKVTPWSDAHFALMERSLQLLGQFGNDALFVPVMEGSHLGNTTGMIRWVKDENGLKPDFTIFDRYLDVYVKHCGPPKAIPLYVWSSNIAKELADVYEGRKIPSRTATPNRPLSVTLWDPKTNTTSSTLAPWFLDAGAEAFWKPMLDGVKDRVVKRGWSERTILLGCGSDLRPSQKTGEVFRQWAPYARWNIYSHFSGDIWPKFASKIDPGAKPTQFIAIGGLEVGLLENPSGGVYGSEKLSTFWNEHLDFLRSSIHRFIWDGMTGPVPYRTMPMHNGRVSRLLVDFWSSGYGAPIWGGYPSFYTWPSADGPAPTVHSQLLREGLQDFEARLTILEAIQKLPKEEQKSYQELLDGFVKRWQAGEGGLSQTELSLDFSTYTARTYEAAEKLSGIAPQNSSWTTPP